MRGERQITETTMKEVLKETSKKSLEGPKEKREDETRPERINKPVNKVTKCWWASEKGKGYSYHGNTWLKGKTRESSQCPQWLHLLLHLSAHLGDCVVKPVASFPLPHSKLHTRTHLGSSAAPDCNVTRALLLCAGESQEGCWPQAPGHRHSHRHARQACGWGILESQVTQP